MDAFAFSARTSDWMTGAASALGLAIPVLIYALTRIGGAMYIAIVTTSEGQDGENGENSGIGVGSRSPG
jgi:hypothetical protein